MIKHTYSYSLLMTYKPYKRIFQKEDCTNSQVKDAECLDHQSLNESTLKCDSLRIEETTSTRSESG